LVQLTDDCFRGDERLMPLKEALGLLAERITAVTESETVNLVQAVGRTLATSVTSARNVPPHDNSAVDGYALRFADLAPDSETTLEIGGRAAAGHPYSGNTAPGQAIRIFTGAAMPDGLDTVVMQEDASVDEDAKRVTVPAGLSQGANRRLTAEDVTAGDIVLAAGRRLKAQDIGLAASVGVAELSVYRKLRAAVFSTGDEVRDPGDSLGAGEIYDANRYFLNGLISGLGAEVTDVGILPDNPKSIRDALATAAETHDLIVTSGGVSVGEEDHVKPAVQALGSLHFWRLAVKPGRPIALGQVAGVPFVGLPGNPAAAMVTFLRFARPMILRLGGATSVDPIIVRVRAAFDHKKKTGRREWVRARIQRGEDGTPEAHKFPREGAGILTSMVESDGLLELPEDMSKLKAGVMVDFIPFSEVGA